MQADPGGVGVDCECRHQAHLQAEHHQARQGCQPAAALCRAQQASWARRQAYEVVREGDMVKLSERDGHAALRERDCRPCTTLA
jgi:hypothetical protein